MVCHGLVSISPWSSGYRCWDGWCPWHWGQLSTVSSMSLLKSGQKTNVLALRWHLTTPWCPAYSFFKVSFPSASGMTIWSPFMTNPSSMDMMSWHDESCCRCRGRSAAWSGQPSRMICLSWWEISFVDVISCIVCSFSDENTTMGMILKSFMWGPGEGLALDSM